MSIRTTKIRATGIAREAVGASVQESPAENSSDRMAHRRALPWLFCVVLNGLMLSGCAQLGWPQSQWLLDGQAAATAQVNRGPQGQPASVKVRVFQLRDLKRFSAADYFSLKGEDSQLATALGNDLISYEEMVLAPCETKAFHGSGGRIDPSARYLGVMAAFRTIDAGEWRNSVDLSELQRRTIRSMAYQTVGKDISIPVQLAFESSKVSVTTARLEGPATPPGCPAPPPTPSWWESLKKSLPSLPAAPTLPSAPEAPTGPSDPAWLL